MSGVLDSGRQISAVVPAGAGAVDVTVTNAKGVSSVTPAGGVHLHGLISNRRPLAYVAGLSVLSRSIPSPDARGGPRKGNGSWEWT